LYSQNSINAEIPLGFVYLFSLNKKILMGQALPPKLQALIDNAAAYEAAGDAYNAVKLLKRAAQLAPERPETYFRLGHIYKCRQEWKPALYYNKKTISLDPSNREAWWNVGLSATALKMWRTAHYVWNKFDAAPASNMPVSARCGYGGQFELLWVVPLDPARGVIRSIPHPAADRRYGDVILFDGQIIGFNIVQRRKVAVYEERGLFKRSPYHTFSCYLQAAEEKDLLILERICEDAGLGFEVWSNATRVMALSNSGVIPEYYHISGLGLPQPQGMMVAIAAKSEEEAQKVLDTWQIISLKSHSNWRRHN
jgi:tetratricopeptide (TPR) repeat protein